MLTQDLHFDLPHKLIATTASQPRDRSRLMICHRKTNQLEHLHVSDLATRTDLLIQGDLLVFNQTRVLPALLTGKRQATGGKVSGLYLSATDDTHWQVMLESKGKLQPNEIIELTPAPGSPENTSETSSEISGGSGGSTLKLIERIEAGQWLVEVQSSLTTLDLLQKVGQTPLPPYIRKARKQLGKPEITDQDQTRYNTVYASASEGGGSLGNPNAGSVAAPTAGLHFTQQLLDTLTARGIEIAFVTLHVGMGTFMPVRTEHVEDHPIHAEPITVTQKTLRQLSQARKQGRRIVPVGTTTVRTLESLPTDWQSIDGDYKANTSLYIYPSRTDFSYRFTDALMTNFHLPESTLLAMVATLPKVGLPNLMDWYTQAIAQEYRFYSYGDAMLIL